MTGLPRAWPRRLASRPFSPNTMSQPQQDKTAITPRRDQDFPEWYQQVVRAADLAEN